MNSMSLDEMRQMMQAAADSVEPDAEEFIEIRSRNNLDIDECGALHAWLINLPETIWSQEDCDKAYHHLLESRCALLTLPRRLVSESIYFKLTWG